ncbi:hypothetical protein ABF87_12340 [Nitrosomonas sp. JL21]|uniref:hypothetical protein n=1 Tax=Nitrosomonas sp. JL21 TaxID=153949 RepID=UPI0013713390|nr:hypothetical protein [Nitrosomonas sp. JL21]MBL8498131.1 hypothetical protein [Nitrosomonas sp.]MXS78729.1 hypothetical protein [Nitrosomonas sp. JL21]
MSDCGCNDSSTGSISVQDLSKEIKEKFQEIVTSIDELETIGDVTSIIFIKNNKIFVLNSSEQVQPINLLISQNLTTSTTYEVKRGVSNKCCAYEVIHYSDKRPDTWIELCCEPYGQQHGDYYFSVNHRSDNKCCIYVQDIIPPAGGNGDPTLSKKREWKCQV